MPVRHMNFIVPETTGGGLAYGFMALPLSGSGGGGVILKSVSLTVVTNPSTGITVRADLVEILGPPPAPLSPSTWNAAIGGINAKMVRNLVPATAYTDWGGAPVVDMDLPLPDGRAYAIGAGLWNDSGAALNMEVIVFMEAP